MGISIYNKNESYDMGYMAFGNFRIEIAKEVDKKLGEMYENFYVDKVTTPQDIVDYLNSNNRIQVNQEFVNFIFASDCDCEMKPEHCADLLECIKNIDNEKEFGYLGRKQLFGEKMITINIFKRMLQDCVKEKGKLRWN